MMTEIERQYQSLLERDKSKEKYYLKIQAGIDASENLYTIAELSKTSTGGEFFKNKANFASSQDYDYIIVSEYEHFADENPRHQIKIRLKAPKSKKNKTPQPTMTTSGLGGFEGYFNENGGISGFIQTKQNNGILSFENGRLQNDINDYKRKIEKLEEKLEALKKENEDFKEKQRSHDSETKKLSDQLSLGSLISQAGMSILAQQFGLIPPQTQQQSIAGIEQHATTSTNQEAKVTISSLHEADSETDTYIDSIVEYLREQNKETLEQIYDVVSFISRGTNNLKKLLIFTQKIDQIIENKANQNQSQTTSINPTEDGTIQSAN